MSAQSRRSASSVENRIQPLGVALAAHGGNEKLRSVQPSIEGVVVELLNYDDRLLINRTGLAW